MEVGEGGDLKKLSEKLNSKIIFGIIFVLFGGGEEGVRGVGGLRRVKGVNRDYGKSNDHFYFIW